MSGFTHYGDKLVYEADGVAWHRLHAAYCGCGRNWIIEHAEAAGLTAVRAADGYVAFTGTGLTDAPAHSLPPKVLWEAVTGTPHHFLTSSPWG